ncbi:MAG: hypothetical protein JSR96_15725 [Proteobacteria bacterium]|nr:hypothetical protein [Pseudomonadota bacterium]
MGVRSGSNQSPLHPRIAGGRAPKSPIRLATENFGGHTKVSNWQDLPFSVEKFFQGGK